MDYDKLAELLKSDDVKCAEIVTYHMTKDGNFIRKTTQIDYYSDGDYHWTSVTKPIYIE
jgi:hypothetical protein